MPNVQATDRHWQTVGITKVGQQQQSPSTLNCGAFSIAAAFHTALGDDVGVLSFDEGKLRPHLAECFELKRLTSFPMKTRCKVRRAPKKHLLVEVNCVCQRPDTFEDMLACDGCDKWMHLSCAKVKEAPEEDWYCFSCKQLWTYSYTCFMYFVNFKTMKY